MGLGLVIFAVIPLSHRWSQYRLLINPLTWLFWKIPTHSQWAIARLQAEAREQLANLIHKPTIDETKDKLRDAVPFIGPVRDPNGTRINQSSDLERQRSQRPNLGLGRYRGVHNKRSGTLCLNLHQMHFEAELTGSSQWSLRYEEVKSLRKVINPGSKNPLSHTADAADEAIMLVDMERREYCVTGLKERDEVFTQIIGYSGVEWQITG